MKIKSRMGRDLDMGQLAAQNSTQVAVGNASMNARGDVIGRGGKIVKSRDDISADYNRAVSKTVQQQVALRNIQKEIFESPAEAVAAHFKPVSSAPTEKAATPPVKPKRKLSDDAE